EGPPPGDTLEVRVLSMEPRLAYGTNIAAWWGHLYDDFGKERITIYRIDTASGLARAALGFHTHDDPATRPPRHGRPPGGRRPPARAGRCRGAATAALRCGRRGATRARADQ